MIYGKSMGNQITRKTLIRRGLNSMFATTVIAAIFGMKAFEQGHERAEIAQASIALVAAPQLGASATPRLGDQN